MLPNFSKLNLVLRSGFGIPISGLQGGLPKTLGAILGQGKSLFGSSGSSFSLPFSTLGEVHLLLRSGTVFATRSDSKVVNQSNPSFVRTLSHTFSVPSVSGPPFQFCEYHIDRFLSESTRISLDGSIETLMAVCHSKVALGDHVVDKMSSKIVHFSNPNGGPNLSFSFKHTDSFRNLSMNMKNQEPSNSRTIYGYFFYDAIRLSCKINPFDGIRDFHSSCTSCCTAGPAPDVLLDGSACEDQPASSAVSSDQKVSSDRTLKLISGSCYLPHPDKEETGGEDAHFICAEEQAIGVADGVGGWADLGVDAGLYARELVSNSVTAIKEEPKGSIDPARVLEKAHSNTKAKGSSTACIVALTDKGIHAINLGDSGFIIVRDGCTVFHSPAQQHGFNFTYQLESGTDGDLPSSGQVFTIPVVCGDVIICGTDGLFDNLYVNEITAVVVHAVRAGLAPQVTAQKIAALARQRAQDTDRQTPFSTAAQDAGFRYYGGKLDDTTVIVSYITSSSNLPELSQQLGLRGLGGLPKVNFVPPH